MFPSLRNKNHFQIKLLGIYDITNFNVIKSFKYLLMDFKTNKKSCLDKKQNIFFQNVGEGSISI